MIENEYREVPYNYTSAGDALVVRLLLGDEDWERLERLRSKRITGRSARLLMRVIGELFVAFRNPFLLEELVQVPHREKRFFAACNADLETIRKGAGDNPDVRNLLLACQEKLNRLQSRIRATPRTRERFLRSLEPVVGKKNVAFDPFTITAHSTDATDWRLHLPWAVVYPESEAAVVAALAAIAGLGFGVIPRGGGTGLTGGAVPVHPDCVVVNTEKLNRILGIRTRAWQTDRGVRETPVLAVEAGVVTEDAMRAAEARGYVFATDPTSAWASTIGGNIAENAGGKTAVLWGTALDNLFSYRVAMPGGRLVEVRRKDHPLRKIYPSDKVIFEIEDLNRGSRSEVILAGDEIRKPGLWKDITNKVLGGLPAVQKEGTDGIITSAEFVLHRPYPCKSTYCLEFFGDSLDEAARVIGELSGAFENRGRETLMALEHFDEEYVKAIGYKVKAARTEPPKAVLLMDMVGPDRESLERGNTRLEQLLSAFPNTSSTLARNPADADRFWKDRKRLGAIARRTNAFKLNEDVVLPLESLPTFARFVELRNLDEERFNQLALIGRLADAINATGSADDPQWYAGRTPQAQELCTEAQRAVAAADGLTLKSGQVIDGLVLALQQLFRGGLRILAELERIPVAERSRLIVVATHMHAGDGNVHVNIPVFSNDRGMMERALRAADDIMAETVRLGGVVSGEHGIGFTKLKYLGTDRIEELSRYRASVDPDRIMNPGKLSDLAVPDRIFTPSFNLLELEARILQHGSLEVLAERISTCVRCGKCKPDCCVFCPEENLFFHPRNKNLAIAAVIELLLYDTQRSHSAKFEALKYLQTIADHCTACHKCLKPCPVDIDTGEISIQERRILESTGHRRLPLMARWTLDYLESRSRARTALFRKGLIQLGGTIQRAAVKAVGNLKSLPVPALLRAPVARVSPRALWEVLPPCGLNQALLLKPPVNADGAVFYFPGCGSERLFSDVALAAVYLLLRSGRQVVLPPPGLCCGFPAHVNAREEQHNRIVLRDSIIFTQIREMFGYLDFRACAISCGTCREALEQLGIADIFGVPLSDVALLSGKSGGGANAASARYLYHAPCHDSLDGQGVSLIRELTGSDASGVPHCCSQAGTLALSKPDLSLAMLRRKARAFAELHEGEEPHTVLTNCPACLQGLGRLNDPGLVPRHFLVELARLQGGSAWRDELSGWIRGHTESVFF